MAERLAGLAAAVRRGEVSARLYNKTLEIREQSPDKAWFRDVWKRSPLYREGEDVWRLEFQLRRAGFSSFRSSVGYLDTWADLQREGALAGVAEHVLLRYPAVLEVKFDRVRAQIAQAGQPRWCQSQAIAGQPSFTVAQENPRAGNAPE